MGIYPPPPPVRSKPPFTIYKFGVTVNRIDVDTLSQILYKAMSKESANAYNDYHNKIVNIHSLYRNWLRENLPLVSYKVKILNEVLIFSFIEEIDAVAFKLRWL